MKNIIIKGILLLLIVSGCKNKIQKIQSSNIPFEKVFILVDSVKLKADNLESMIGVNEGANHSFLLIDYIGKKVVEYDSTGNYVKDILNDQKTLTRKKKMGSPISLLTIGNNLFVADNNNRRIYVLDTTKNEIRRSFILAGTHMTPIHMSLLKGRIVMSGYNIHGDFFLNLYDTLGFYKKSFMKSGSNIDDRKYIISPLNYVSIASNNDTLYTVELMDYTINAFDADGKKLFQKRYLPDYFTPLNSKLLNSIKSSFEEIRNNFSKPSNIAIINHKLMIEVEMPTKKNSDNFFNSREYRIDFFDRFGDPEKIGIIASNNAFLYYSPLTKLCYFLTHYNSENKIYTVKKYKVTL